MTDKLREQISALADNELPEGEHELLLRRFAGERSLRLCWERYHLMGEAMRKGLPAVDTRGLADRVMAVIGEQPTPVVKPAGMSRLWGRAVAGFAVAASVAVVSVLALRHDGRVQQTAANAPAEIVPPEGSSPGVPLAYGLASSASWDGSAPQVQASLRGYLVNHDVMTAALTSQVNARYKAAAPDSGKQQRPKASKPAKKAKSTKADKTPRQP